MMLDFGLAAAHHLLVFALLVVLAVQLALVRVGTDPLPVRGIARLDLAYGLAALLLLAVGLARASLASKGWEYYQQNSFFWAKLATFLLVGLLSVPPSLAYRRWRRSGLPPTDEEVVLVRRFLRLELCGFCLLPVFAAAMARGIYL